MNIVRDEGLSDLVSAGSEQTVCGGFRFTEGPAWSDSRGGLYFTDIPRGRIHFWSQTSSELTIAFAESGNANGLAIAPDGALLACEHSNRRVSRYALDGTRATLADSFEGKRLNRPNDVIIASTGVIYFTDPNYGYARKGDPKPGAPDGVQELPFQGVFAVSADGAPSLVIDDLELPNGLALSPDQSLLYVADSGPRVIHVLSLDPDGRLLSRRVFADLDDDVRAGVPDGMKVDSAGRLWTTGPGGIWVFAPDGEVLGTMEFPELPANLEFGGPNRSTLFLTARTSLYSLETSVRGAASQPIAEVI